MFNNNFSRNNNGSNNNNDKVENLLNTVSRYLGKDPKKLKESMQKGNIAQSLNNLNTEDAAKIKKILSDKNLASKLLSSPKAQQLLNDIMGDQKNG